MTRRLLVRLLVLGLVLCAVLAGCAPAPTDGTGPTTSTVAPTASASPTATVPASPGSTSDDATIFRTIAGQVIALRGLAAPTQVEPTIIDRTALQKNLQAEFDKDNPTDQIAQTERIDKALGFLAPGASLRDLYLKLQGSQVIGYYDPTAKRLFIVSHDGGLGPTERLTYAHEFTHQLQDGRFDLNSLGLDKLSTDSDRALAILSLVEGDAVGIQTSWMIANLTPVELGQVAAEASDPATLAIIASMPPLLLETSLFPYQAGAAFVNGLRGSGGNAAVDAAFGRLPASTEQILHPDTYAAGVRPVNVTLPTDLAARFGSGWTETATDTMGELQIRVWLKQGGVAGDVARTAADGWGGDRMILVAGPAGASVLVFESVWDSAADADAFHAAATVAIAGLKLDGAIAQSRSRVVIGIRSGSAPAGTPLDDLIRGLAGSATS